MLSREEYDRAVDEREAPVRRAPFTAPWPMEGELIPVYITRLAQAFEDWVNRG